MKTTLSVILTGILLLFAIESNSQVVNPVKKAKKKGSKEVNKEVDKKLNKLTKDVKGIFGKKKKGEKKQENKDDTNKTNKNIKQQENTPILVWSKYDFIPGDRIIFEDNLVGEENGEFPSRWDLYKGNVEIAEFGGENVIMFRDGSPTIIPYMKNSKEDYLPEVFTIEFDLYSGNDNFSIYFYDRKNQRSSGTYLQIKHNQMQYSRTSSKLEDHKQLTPRRWIHVAIAHTKGKLKAYIDDTRLINIPRIDFNPSGISFHSYHSRNGKHYYVKNIRIAEGGVKYYDRIIKDGKIIANGIRFEVNKSTLLPESMGIINKIYKLMIDKPEIKFKVEGHTDTDGDFSSNQILSEKRANTVITTLTKMGISENRLSSKGWGESKPIDTNTTPEGKANNRRVEFVLIK